MKNGVQEGSQKPIEKTLEKIQKIIEKWSPNRGGVNVKLDPRTTKITLGWPHGPQRPPQGAQVVHLSHFGEPPGPIFQEF